MRMRSGHWRKGKFTVTSLTQKSEKRRMNTLPKGRWIELRRSRAATSWKSTQWRRLARTNTMHREYEASSKVVVERSFGSKPRTESGCFGAEARPGAMFCRAVLKGKTFMWQSVANYVAAFYWKIRRPPLVNVWVSVHLLSFSLPGRGGLWTLKLSTAPLRRLPSMCGLERRP